MEMIRQKVYQLEQTQIKMKQEYVERYIFVSYAQIRQRIMLIPLLFEL